ncbi:MAG: PEPxxWA-CTERM sorting domain-containing protein [Sphingomonadales bacterium]|nr:PEPxxWA-CTERM sorting domain-containing protein [Sphingomonadales bacterium]
MKKFAIAALAALILPTPAFADVELIKNGSFEVNKVADGDKVLIHNAGLTDWSFDPRPGSTPNSTRNYTWVASPGTADKATSGSFGVYPGFPINSPDGGDFIFADGDTNYNGALYQTVSGLTVGQKYTLNFWQAAGQQDGKTGPTTEMWKVMFGNDVQYSTKFLLPEGGHADWQQQSMTFVASQTSQMLSFLAEGTPNGHPPISMLDGVSLKAAVGVPEPGTWAMMIMGFGAVAGVMRSRPRKAVRA